MGGWGWVPLSTTVSAEGMLLLFSAFDLAKVEHIRSINISPLRIVPKDGILSNH